MNFSIAFAIGFSVASIPGPTIILIATQTLRHGARAGLLTMAAPLALDATVMLPLGLMLQASLFAGERTVVLGLCGTAFLLWLGIQSIRSGIRQLRVSDPESRDPETLKAELETPNPEMAPFLKGILTHVSSPYPYLYWATVGASFVRQEFARGGVVGAALFPIGFWVGGSSFTLIVIYLMARGKRLLPAEVEPYLHHFSGALLIGSGIYLGVSVWHGLF